MAFGKTREEQLKNIRSRAENDLFFFARLVNPHRVYGAIHEELYNWWTKSEQKDNTLALLPRDHQKSHCAATLAAWILTKNPWATILYVSATADLAEKQLYAIKNILSSKIYRRYWPEMVNEEEAKRELWNIAEIAVDHPRRKAEGVRDPSVKAAGLTTNFTGFHANYIFLDDVVVPLNAYTEDGRKKVAAMYSQLASVKTTQAKTFVVGTRYHPQDLYKILMEIEVEYYENGEIVSKNPLYEVFQKVVEENGEFLWPKSVRSDGRAFGFDDNELAKKRAEYVDKSQFFAQYYNNPNSPDTYRINPDFFQYYDRKFVKNLEGAWYFKDQKLNLYAAMDFAFSLSRRADYSTIVVVGVDANYNYFVLDIARFKTDLISEYARQLILLYNKWGFRKVRAEVVAAQKAIVRDLKENYIKANGLVLSVDEYNPSKALGHKDERLAAILKPRYENRQVWHYKGGNCQLLEEELVLEKPPHDDMIDALAAAIDVAVPPARRAFKPMEDNKVIYHPRFGGVKYA
jgi:hypothetical protein